MGTPGPDDQGIFSLAIVRLLDSALADADSELPNPFLGMPSDLLGAGAQLGPALVAELRSLAHQLAERVPRLDPDDEGVLLVLAQLALLDIDLEHLDADLVDDLNLLPPGSFERAEIERGWTELRASRHATARMRADLDAIAAQFAARSGLAHIRAPYARGGSRATVPRTRRLREALRQLKERQPGLELGTLLAPTPDGEHPELTQLREALGWDPDVRTLERNWPQSRH